MPPHHIMMSQRGGLGNVGFKKTYNFSFDFVGTFFDVVPIEARREILILEAK